MARSWPSTAFSAAEFWFFKPYRLAISAPSVLAVLRLGVSGTPPGFGELLPILFNWLDSTLMLRLTLTLLEMALTRTELRCTVRPPATSCAFAPPATFTLLLVCPAPSPLFWENEPAAKECVPAVLAVLAAFNIVLLRMVSSTDTSSSLPLRIMRSSVHDSSSQKCASSMIIATRLFFSSTFRML